MKIICIHEYYIEEHYRCKNVIPLEYSSIDQLWVDIYSACDVYFEALQKHEISYRESRQRDDEIESSSEYKDLESELAIISKKVKIKQNNTPRVQRDSEWEREVSELKDRQDEIRGELSKLREANILKVYPHPENIFKTGKFSIDIPTYLYDSLEELKEYINTHYTFQSIDDWFSQSI